MGSGTAQWSVGGCNLLETAMVSQVMSPKDAGGSAFMASEDKLKADGSNYLVWCTMVGILLHEAGVMYRGRLQSS